MAAEATVRRMADFMVVEIGVGDVGMKVLKYGSSRTKRRVRL